MNKIVITLFLFCSFYYGKAQQYDTLHNKTIIALTKMKLPTKTIINKIKTSYTSFDVSVNALLDLQANGVDGDVIDEMMKRNDNANAQASKDVNSSNPNTMHKPGIYYYDPTNSSMKKVDATVTSTTKSGGYGTALAQFYTSGLAKNKVKTGLAGIKSHLELNEQNPVFYFYFENNVNPNADSWFFATATSPNEFALVNLDIKKDSREMVIGESNAYGNAQGVPNKIKVLFDYDEISEGIYKVYFKHPIKKGEYCFLYTSSTPSRYNNDKVFDFGIQ